jgi:type I restriction enzyme S subunit
VSFPRYPRYKSSGVQWLGQVPADWDVRPLRKLAVLTTGVTPPTEDPGNYCEDGPFPWVRPEDLDESGAPTLSSKRLTEKGWAHTRRVPAGSSLICCIGTIGKVGFVAEDVSTNQQITAATFARCARYFHFALRAGKAALEIEATGNVLRILNCERLGRIELPAPPEREADRIAAFLDRETAKIDALLAEQRRLIGLLKEKRRAVTSRVIAKGLSPPARWKPSGVEWLGEVPAHWQIGRCGYYAAIVPGFLFQSARFTKDERETKLLRGINVGVSRIKWDETVYWRRSQGDGLDAYELKGGELVMGMDRPWIGEGVRVAKVEPRDLPCLLLQRVAALKAGPLLDSDYLLHLLSSEMFVAHFSPATTGISVPHISTDQIADFVIPLPPLAEQRQIVEYLAGEHGKLDALTAESQHAVDLLQERRAALISAAVTGQIDVRHLGVGPPA